MIGQNKRKRAVAEKALADTLADIETALAIVCRLPDSPDRTHLYAVLEARAHVLRQPAMAPTLASSR